MAPALDHDALGGLRALLDAPLPTGLPGETGPENRLVARSVESTNRLAARIAREALDEALVPPELLVVAHEQRGGRGRRGRAWSSPAGAGTYLTRLLGVPLDAPIAQLPLLVPLSLRRALGRWIVEDDCRIKWPNDLLVDGAKLAGILIESIRRGDEPHLAVVVGIGVNLRSETLPAGATSLSALLGPGEAPALVELTRAVAEELELTLGRWRRAGAEGVAAEELMAAYRQASFHAPGDRIVCRVGERELHGELLGFDLQGNLQLATDDGTRETIGAGEIIEPAARAVTD